MDLDTVADELYGLLPGEFVAARDARAREARDGGQGPLAREMKSLRKPSASAWLVNLLVRRRHGEVGELLSLAGALRDAQDQLAESELLRLAERRRVLVSGLVRDARHLADEVGQPASGASLRDLEDTLAAALADPAAAEAVASGRLTTSLRYSGFGSVDLDAAVGGPLAARSSLAPASGAPASGAPAPAAPAAAKPARRSETPRPDDGPGRSARGRGSREARDALRDARRALSVASRHGEERRAQAAQAQQDVARIRREIVAAQGRLTSLREEERQAAEHVRSAERARVAAEKEERAAGVRLRGAERKVGANREGGDGTEIGGR